MSLALSLALSMMVSAPAPELIVDVDFNDEVMIRPEPITEAQVERLVRDLHAAGATTLLVRMGYLGYLPYRTKLSYPVGFDAEHARRHPYGRDLPPGELEEFIKTRQAANDRYRKVIETFNPPEVFLRIGHELGMKVVMWIDIFRCCSSPTHAYWTTKALDPPPSGDLFAWAAAQYQPYCRGKTRLYLFSEWLPGPPAALDADLAAWAKRVLDNRFDGIDMHEAANFEQTPGGMAILKRLDDRLDGKAVGALK